MSWGLSLWGRSLWGDALIGLAAPSLYDLQPGSLDVQGGTLVTFFGDNFSPEFVPELLVGPPGGPHVLVAEGYLFDPDFDMTPVRAITGMPAAAAGTYSVRVRTPTGTSNVLQDVITYLPFAEATYTLKARDSWAAKWRVGRRLRA